MNLGQGGNSAIEDAAALANALNAALKVHQSSNLSVAELDRALSQYQVSRLPRVKKIAKYSYDGCRIQGVEGMNFPLFVASYWLKSTPWVNMQEEACRGAMTLNFLPAPKRVAKEVAQRQSHGNILAFVVGLLWGCGVGFFMASPQWTHKFIFLG